VTDEQTQRALAVVKDIPGRLHPSTLICTAHSVLWCEPCTTDELADAAYEESRWTLRGQPILTSAEVAARWPEALCYLDVQLPDLTTGREIRFVTTSHGKRLRIAIKDRPKCYMRTFDGRTVEDQRHKSPSWDDTAKVWVRFSEVLSSGGFPKERRLPRLFEPEALARVAMANRWLECRGSQWRAEYVCHGDIVFTWPGLPGRYGANFEGAPLPYMLRNTQPGTLPAIPRELRRINDADYEFDAVLNKKWSGATPDEILADINATIRHVLEEI
jgi:hypothetical protein